MKNFKLERDNTIFLFIDIQDRLLKAIHNRDELLERANIMAKMADIMNIESIVTVQYPKGLGHTNADLLEILKTDEIAKTEFSCMLNQNFRDKINSSHKKQIVVVGSETHICVMLTARDLLADGYQVYVAADAVGSRDKFNHKNGLDQMDQMGAVITNVESIMFDLNSISGTDEFKAVQKLII